MGERAEESETQNINPTYMYNRDLAFTLSVSKNVCTNKTVACTYCGTILGLPHNR